MLRTRLCMALGVELPIISAPMGPDLSGPELAAAVSGAGGLGIIQAQFHPPDLLREALRRVRSLTDKPFGVGFLLHFPCEKAWRFASTNVYRSCGPSGETRHPLLVRLIRPA